MRTEQERQRARAWIFAAVVGLSAATPLHAAHCEMQLSENTVDYGRLNRADLYASTTQDRNVLLGKRKLTLNVICKTPSSIALRFSAQAAQSGGYVFAGKGGFTVRLSEATLDGAPVMLAKTDASGRSAQGAASGQYVEPGEGVAAILGGTPALGEHFVVGVEIEASMPRTAMQVRDESLLEGLGRLELLPP